jgi:hypothetical protein
MDYPILQAKYLEREMKGGPLHLYTSVFGVGLILQGEELPEPMEEESAQEEPTKDELT